MPERAVARMELPLLAEGAGADFSSFCSEELSLESFDWSELSESFELLESFELHESVEK